jgi:hypothetical protein
MDLRRRAPRAADSSEVDTVGDAGEIAENHVEKLRWEAIRPWTARFASAGHGGIWGQPRSVPLIPVPKVDFQSRSAVEQLDQLPSCRNNLLILTSCRNKPVNMISVKKPFKYG